MSPTAEPVIYRTKRVPLLVTERCAIKWRIDGNEFRSLCVSSVNNVYHWHSLARTKPYLCATFNCKHLFFTFLGKKCRVVSFEFQLRPNSLKISRIFSRTQPTQLRWFQGKQVWIWIKFHLVVCPHSPARATEMSKAQSAWFICQRMLGSCPASLLKSLALTPVRGIKRLVVKRGDEPTAPFAVVCCLFVGITNCVNQCTTRRRLRTISHSPVWSIMKWTVTLKKTAVFCCTKDGGPHRGEDC